MLAGKTAVITGCLQGIGRQTMRTFAENNCDIFACSYKRTEEFELEINTLKTAHGVEIIPLYFDMADAKSLKSAALEIQKTKKPIDILVNIAGITRDAVFQMTTSAQMQETFLVNFFSHVVFSQYMAKLMLKNGGGRIVFTSSISALDGNEGQLSYGASKAAIVSAVKTMSKELAPKGIRVNAIAPGVIKTPMTDVLDADTIKAKLDKSDLHRIGKPEEVANLIMFLVSDMSSYITGQIIRVDGGIG